MNIETLGIHGIDIAIHAMRNPMDSWAKSDSKWVADDMFKVGEKDKELSLKLQKAGPEHCKHLRMIMVYADMTFPRYWWTEFDTYRNGVEKVSCSTMHKLTARPLTFSDFEHDAFLTYDFQNVLESINSNMDLWRSNEDPEEKKDIWRGIIQMLPQSYLQKRTVMMSYAALRNIVRQREGHKLIEWHKFIEWAKGLPEAWMIFDE